MGETDGRDARTSARRTVGFGLYNTWILATFYNTYLFNESGDFRSTLYLNMLVSLACLVATLLVVPRVVPRCDKWVLSKSFAFGAGTVMTLATVLLAFADTSSALGVNATVASGVLTGFSSGVLLMGWGRLYTDVGPRTAMVEMGASWLIAALADVVLSVIPGVPAFVLTLGVAMASAVLLRESTFSRPDRPRPPRDHRLQRRTRLVFARGLCACALLGVVAGFSDVLAGFRYVPVPDRYEILLAVDVAVVAVVVALVMRLSDGDYMRNIRRVVILLIVLGCQLTLFVDRVPALGNIVIFGAYQCGFAVMLAGICIDVSNYFDQAATLTFGTTFGTLYLGETAGNILGHVLVLGMGVTVFDLPTIVTAMTAAILVSSLFLFTESDLIETSVGEMTDEEVSDEEVERRLTSGVFAMAGAPAGGDGGGQGADGGSAGSPEAPAAPTVEDIAALLSQRAGLTAREAQVLPLVLRGRTIARIQEELHISQGTVSTHIRHIYQKTGVHNRQELLDMMESDELRQGGDGAGR